MTSESVIKDNKSYENLSFLLSAGQFLDTLFIDEGFGTLDDDVLDNLSDGGNHLAGIISHVSRLEESITEKIVVKQGSNGSTLRIEGTEN